MSVFLKLASVPVLLTMFALLVNSGVIVEKSAGTLAPMNSTSEDLCKENQTKFDGCNNCFCANGQWACTMRGCFFKPTPEPLVPVQVLPLPPGNMCSVGQTKSLACNSCICDNGRWSCTKRGCPTMPKFRRSEKEQCTKGSTKDKDGLTCTCVDGANWQCPVPRWYPHRTLDQ